MSFLFTYWELADSIMISFSKRATQLKSDNLHLKIATSDNRLISIPNYYQYNTSYF